MQLLRSIVNPYQNYTLKITSLGLITSSGEGVRYDGAMVFLLFVGSICAITTLIPVILNRVGVRVESTRSPLPYLASALFLVAFLIPDIHISNETNTFQQHFVGGGLYSLCLYLYFKQAFKWRFTGPLEIIVLFAWTSAFGVANELLEFSLVKLQFVSMNLTDSDWDLVANSLGALVGYLVYLILNKTRSKRPYYN